MRNPTVKLTGEYSYLNSGTWSENVSKKEWTLHISKTDQASLNTFKYYLKKTSVEHEQPIAIDEKKKTITYKMGKGFNFFGFVFYPPNQFDSYYKKDK